MHPINDIRGSGGTALKGKRIVLGITGSIAAVEVVKMARELARLGADVIPVMSSAATKIVHPDAIHFATGRVPIIELDGAVQHVELCGDSSSRADVLLIAPATANTISKIAHGIDDTPVTTMASCALGSGMPIIIVPAMHGSMYNHDIIMENVEKLQSVGVIFVGPRMDEGKAKMATRDEIITEVCRAAGPGDLLGKKVLVIAGSTREPIDDVRFITNRSSGKTGLALAWEAYRRGADVEVWAGEGVKAPSFAKCLTFVSVRDLQKMAPKAKADIIIVPAAISDFTVEAKKGKMSSEKGQSLKLEPAQKILGLFGKRALIIGFKAETGITRKALEERARERMKKHNLGMIVANLLEDVKADETKAMLILPGKKLADFKGKKSELAEVIFNTVLGA
jgi:phosphopantothenoylcysteine decarboxylase/phosphopantothenate--cysteine ligase